MTSPRCDGYIAIAVTLPLFCRSAFVARLLLASGLAAVTGCNDDSKTTVYRIPKEAQPEAQAPQPGMTGEAAPAVHWKAPAGWQEQPATGFRKGSFLVRGADGKQADISVISFPQTAGGLLANVNRWRDQLKLAPFTDESQAGAPMTIAGQQMAFLDFVSEQPLLPDGSKSRILGAILPLGAETWFFKMMGPDELVESQRDSFRQFLETVHLAESAAGPAPAAAMPGVSTNAPVAPSAEAPQPSAVEYKLPANWHEKPLTPMRVASFDAAAANGKQVDVSIVSLSGMAGGDLANVNRWRDQVKLGPIDEAALQKSAEHIKSDARDFLVVDMTSAAPIGDKNEKQRIVAAILDENERSWFVKMTGEDEAVGSQKSAFAEFLRSLKIP